MRWAIVGSYNLDSLEYHLHDTLTHLGHEAKCFDLSLAFNKGKAIRYWMGRLSQSFDESNTLKLAKEIVLYAPDYLIVAYRHVHPVLVSYIKEKMPAITTLQVNPDHIATLEQQQILATPFDYYFTKEPFMQRFLHDKAGLNAHYLPESFNVRLHFPPTVDKRALERELDIDVLFFGNMYPYRTRIIEQLIDRGIRVKLFGAPGRYFPESLRSHFENRMITGADKCRHIYGARIVFNSFHFAEIEAANCKYFEIGGIGGFQICDDKAGLHEYSLIPPGEYTYETIDEAIDLIHRYLPLQEHRHEIAAAQRNHFLAHHTYEHRIASMLDIMDNSVNTKVQ